MLIRTCFLQRLLAPSAFCANHIREATKIDGIGTVTPMAKLTKKIRIEEYDVLKNEFKISFQLAGFADHLKFVSTYTYPGRFGFDGNGEHELTLLGLNAGEIEQIVEEIFEWVEKPRKQLDGNCHGYTMRSMFAITDRPGQEPRGKAEAERIIVEAPRLDWAMSALDQ